MTGDELRECRRMCKDCGFDPEDRETWMWWITIGPKERKALLKMSNPKKGKMRIAGDAVVANDTVGFHEIQNLYARPSTRQSNSSATP